MAGSAEYRLPWLCRSTVRGRSAALRRCTAPCSGTEPRRGLVVPRTDYHTTAVCGVVPPLVDYFVRRRVHARRLFSTVHSGGKHLPITLPLKSCFRGASRGLRKGGITCALIALCNLGCTMCSLQFPERPSRGPRKAPRGKIRKPFLGGCWAKCDVQLAYTIVA
jgi:hypothetical protein